MKQLVLLLFAVASQALSQDIGSLPAQDIPRPGVSPFQKLSSFRGNGSYSHVIGFLSITSFGLSGRTYISLAPRDQVTPELSVGLLRMNSGYVPQTLVGGYTYSQALLVLPVYFGVRYNLAEGGTAGFDWSWFVRGGGGPAVGMLTPLSLSFFDALDRSTFHFGAGVFAATGLEFTFNESYTVFVQGGADYTGFFRPIGDRHDFFGPSFSIGFGKLIP
jgi:hypothetical protein